MCVYSRSIAVLFRINPMGAIFPLGKALKGGQEARPYKTAPASWVGAGFIPARHSRWNHETR